MNEDDPDNRSVPPEDASYQSIVSPFKGVAEIDTLPALHLDPFTAAGGLRKPDVIIALTAVLDDDRQLVTVLLASA